MESVARVRTSVEQVQPVGVQKVTSAPATDNGGLLESLSPEMAREIGDAFSLDKIGSKPQVRRRTDRSRGARSGAVRFAGRIAAFLLVTGLAVSVTVAALYFMQLS